MPEGAMVGMGPEDERGARDSPGERRRGEERPRPAMDEPESGAWGSGGGGRRPRRHVPLSVSQSLLSSVFDSMRAGGDGDEWRISWTGPGGLAE
jgi:hypothetical protein